MCILDEVFASLCALSSAQMTAARSLAQASLTLEAGHRVAMVTGDDEGGQPVPSAAVVKTFVSWDVRRRGE